MANSKDKNLISFVAEHYDRSSREIARMWIDKTWETCDNGTIIKVKNNMHRWNAINNYSVQENTPAKNIPLLRHKTTLEDWSKTSVLIKNPMEAERINEYKEWLKDLIQEWITKKIQIKKQDKFQEKQMLVTISDCHVWLAPNESNLWLFEYEYNEQVFNTHLSLVLNGILEKQSTMWTIEEFVLQDLGDSLDWWNKHTTRGWHILNQNMSNREAFRVYVQGIVSLWAQIIESKVANKYIFRHVVNDNHWGDFASIANFSIQEILSARYWDMIEFQTVIGIIQHYTFWKHTFITTHWKDDKQMNRPMPLHLNAKTINYILQYIRYYKIKSEFIHVQKWDQHRVWFEYHDVFDYRNFCSLAPWSMRQQANFGSSYWWYAIDVINKNNGDYDKWDRFIRFEKKHEASAS